MGNPITGQGYIDHQKSGRRKFPTDSSSTSVNTSMLLDSRVKENRNPKKECTTPTYVSFPADEVPTHSKLEGSREAESEVAIHLHNRLLARLQSSKF
jgi:hypothetical protein